MKVYVVTLNAFKPKQTQKVLRVFKNKKDAKYYVGFVEWCLYEARNNDSSYHRGYNHKAFEELTESLLKPNELKEAFIEFKIDACEVR